MKKIITLFLAATLLFSTSTITLAKSSAYSDVVKTYWAYNYIMGLSESNVFSGYTDGKFYPTKNITRAEFAKILDMAFDIPVTSTDRSSFVDVDTKEWYAPYIMAGMNYLDSEIIEEEPYYHPNVAITREAVAVALVKAKGYDVSQVDDSALSQTFTDDQTIHEENRKYVLAAVQHQLISGYEDHTFRAQSNITRAEAAVLFFKACPSKVSNNYKPEAEVILQTGDVANTTELFYKEGDIEVRKVPVSQFSIEYWNKDKATIPSNSTYDNGGYFGKDSELGTYPVANLKCDIDANTLSDLEKYYFITTKERGRIEDTKLIVESKTAPTSDSFYNKYISTLLTYADGTANIQNINTVPQEATYALAGAPVMVDGKDVSWASQVAVQGFDKSIARPTWHRFLCMTADNRYIYNVSLKTTSSNLWYSSEAYNRLKSMGFIQAIKVDGGGSFINAEQGNIVLIDGAHRIINNILHCN